MAGTVATVRHLLTVAMLVGVAGCTPAVAPPTPPQTAAAGGGTILSVRAIERHTAVEPLRAALLTDAEPAKNAGDPLVEFIVRADDGTTLSIVQANDSAFRQGDRVVILRAAQTHLARP